MLVVCYLGAGGVLLATGRARADAGGIAMHLLVLGAVSAATLLPRSPAWLVGWAPIASVLYLYATVPALIQALGHRRFYDETLISWEAALFGGQPAIDWALAWPGVWLSEVLHAAYLSYYGIIVVIPALLWLRRRPEFAEAVFVLMLTFVACFVAYLAFPAQGPRYLWPGSAPDGPLRRGTLALLEARSSPGTAFPSSHVAVATTQCVLAWRYFGRASLVLPALTGLLALGAVYGGFHYAIDVIAGAVFGLLVALLGLEVHERISRAADDHTNATAPTKPRSAVDSGSSTSSSGTAST